VSIVVHGLVVMVWLVSWPDDELSTSDGVVNIELIQIVSKIAPKTVVETGAVAHDDISHLSEMTSSQAVKTESAPVRMPVKLAPETHIEIDKQVVARPEKEESSDLDVSNQERVVEQAKARKRWERVRAKLEEKKWYPASARRRGIQGNVELGFSLNKKGYTRYTTVLTGSGYAMLDQAALETVKRAEPFPANGGEYRFKLRFSRL